MHQRMVHGHRCTVKHFVGPDACCPICKTTFSTRLRCIAHLTDKRRRGNRIPCGELLASSDANPWVPAEVARLDAVDREVRRAAHRSGRTTPLSCGLPQRRRDAESPVEQPQPPKRRRIIGKTVGAVFADIYPANAIRYRPGPGMAYPTQ